MKKRGFFVFMCIGFFALFLVGFAKAELSSGRQTFSYKCTDTDKGANFDIKGTAKVIQTICTYSSKSSSCSSGAQITKRDYCNTTKILYEYYCDTPTSRSISQQPHDCLYGCEYGRCTPRPMMIKPFSTIGYSIADYSDGNKSVAMFLFGLSFVLLLFLLLGKKKNKLKSTKKRRKKSKR